MNAKRYGLAERSAIVRWVEPLIVQPVTALMDAAKKARGQVVLVDASGDANVCRMERRGEGMGRQIQPPLFEVVAHRDEHQTTEFQLPGLIIGMVQKGVVDLDGALLNALQ